MRGVAWHSGLSGTGGARHGRRLAFTEGWGAGYSDPDYIAASPCAAANLPLIRLEPILKAHAEASGGASVRFHHELVDLVQDEDGVTSTVLDRDSGETYEVRSAYVLGADGGRTVGELIGVEMEGVTNLRDVVTVHISADLSRYFDDPGPMIRWVYNPDSPQHLDFGCVLVAVGPNQWGHRSEEWVVNMPYPYAHPDASDPAKVMKRIGDSIGIPGFSPKLHALSTWVMESLLASRSRPGGCSCSAMPRTVTRRRAGWG